MCPICRTRISFNPLYNDDNDHDCVSNSETLRNEDIVRIGAYVDDNGVVQDNPNSFNAGMPKKNWGKTSWIEGARVQDITSRGNIRQTHSTRKRQIFMTRKGDLFKSVKLKNDKKSL